jgi:hypothetical protein
MKKEAASTTTFFFFSVSLSLSLDSANHPRLMNVWQAAACMLMKKFINLIQEK